MLTLPTLLRLCTVPWPEVLMSVLLVAMYAVPQTTWHLPSIDCIARQMLTVKVTKQRLAKQAVPEHEGRVIRQL